jgi:hypothetical protein
VLVAAALGVPTFNKDRLRKLVKYHEKQVSKDVA